MEYTWEEPLCLVENSGERGLEINPDTLARLSRVKVPVSVVAIVGLYRTGKSLFNELVGWQSERLVLVNKNILWRLSCCNSRTQVVKLLYKRTYVTLSIFDVGFQSGVHNSIQNQRYLGLV